MRGSDSDVDCRPGPYDPPLQLLDQQEAGLVTEEPVRQDPFRPCPSEGAGRCWKRGEGDTGEVSGVEQGTEHVPTGDPTQ